MGYPCSTSSHSSLLVSWYYTCYTLLLLSAMPTGVLCVSEMAVVSIPHWFLILSLVILMILPYIPYGQVGIHHMPLYGHPEQHHVIHEYL